MDMKRSIQQLLLLCAALMLILPAVSALNFEDQKNFFFHDPTLSTPPTVVYTPPPSGGGGHATTTPPHGGDGYRGSPPANHGAPPSGRHHTSNPSTPPHHGGGGSYHSPPNIAVPSPPLPSDPNSPPFTCTFWKNHPTLIWGVVGWWGTVGNAFGDSNVPAGFGANMNLVEALENTRADGYGEICREGTAALLNAMADHTKFPYTVKQVRDRFAAAIISNKSALAQATLFKLANEGRITA